MSTPTPTMAERRDFLRPLRYLLRVPLLLLFVFVVTPVFVLLILIRAGGLRLAGEQLDHRLVRLWAQCLLRACGLHLKRNGEPLPGAVMFVANHMSWLDITVLHSQRMMSFVAKAEIARWPIVGWLAKTGSTVFHRRGSGDSLTEVQRVLVARLQSGLAIGVFPEGTTGRGHRVGPFHARIFQVAVEAGAPIQPVAIRFLRHGRPNPAFPFTGDETLVANLFRVLGEPTTVAEVDFLEPIRELDQGRRYLAHTARERIARLVDHDAA